MHYLKKHNYWVDELINGNPEVENPTFEKRVILNEDYKASGENKIFYDSLLTRRPFPGDEYIIVPYLTKKGSFIVCEDDCIAPFSNQIIFECEIFKSSTYVSAPIFGSGYFPTTSNTGYYSWSFWDYLDNKMNFWFYGGSGTAGGVDFPEGRYKIRMVTTRNSATLATTNFTVSDGDGNARFTGTRTNHTLKNDIASNGPFTIWNVAMRETAYSPNWGMPYNRHATATENNIGDNYASKKWLWWYDGAKMWKDGKLYAYYRTCYKRTTHQYGVYNQVTGQFWPAAYEKLNYTDQTFDYAGWVETRSEEYRYQRERAATQLRVVGGEGEGY